MTAEKAVKYRSAWVTVIIGMVFTSAASLVLRWMFIRENQRRDALEAEKAPSGVFVGDGAVGDKEAEARGEVGDEGIDGRTDHDYTDKERPEFRYTT